jgi:hypothetical protein
VTPADADWRDRFCGRQAELARLRDAFDAVADGAGPQAIVVLGDRGLGKTRLVREFYGVLTRERDPDHYWPDGTLFQGRNVLVGPDVERDPAVRAHFAGFALAARRLPFLWWGMRLSDPDERNAPVTDLATHRRFLDVHLEPLRQARRLLANRDAVADLGRDVARSGVMKAVEAIPFVGPWASLAVEAALFSRKRAELQDERRRLLEEQQTAEVTRLSRLRAEDVLGATLADLEAVLGNEEAALRTDDPGTPAVARVPLVLFVDDAQFARPGGDEGVLELVTELWRRAVAGGWPLLLLAAHWEREWRDADAGPAGFAARFRPLLEAIDGWQPLVLGREPQLDALVRAGLPALPASDVALVLEQADGNPQLLLEIVDRIRRSPAWRDAGGGLSPDGRQQLASTRFDLYRLIRERMESDATPDAVRRAVAASSVQGVEFSCALTEALAGLLQAGPVREGLADAEARHRYVLGVDRGVAAFLQRAYRQAALDLVGGQLGSPERVDAALARAADTILDDDARWTALNEAERDAVLALRAGLGEHAAEPDVRARAAAAMGRLAWRALALDPAAPDVPRAARWGRRIAAGLVDARFQPATVGRAELLMAAEAVRLWDGAGAALPLLDALAGTRWASDAEDAGERIDLLLALADGRHAAGRFEEAEAAAREALATARTLVTRDPGLGAQRRLLATLGAEARRLKRTEQPGADLPLRREQHALARTLAAAHPGDDTVQRDHAWSALQLAAALNAGTADDAEEPFALLLPARAELERLLQREAMNADLSLLGHLDLEIARSLQRRGEAGDATRWFAQAVDWLGSAYATEPRYAYRRGLLEAASTAAESAWALGDRSRALALLHQARVAMEAVQPPPDLTHGVLLMSLYHRLVAWTLAPYVEAGIGPDAPVSSWFDDAVAPLLASAQALLLHVPIAAGTYAELAGRAAGTLRAAGASRRARASIADADTADAAALEGRATALRSAAEALLTQLGRAWGLRDWFDAEVMVLDEQLRRAVRAGDGRDAVALAEALLRSALAYQARLADDGSLGALLYATVVAGQAVLEQGGRLDPALVRAGWRAAATPWQEDPPDDPLPWMRAPALAVLALLDHPSAASERRAVLEAVSAAFDAAPSWLGQLAGYALEVELGFTDHDAPTRCRHLDALATALPPSDAPAAADERFETRWLAHLRHTWQCAPPAGAARETRSRSGD